MPTQPLPIDFSALSATALVTLFCRAQDTTSANPIVHDPTAVALVQRIRPLLAGRDDGIGRMLAGDNLPSQLVTFMALRAAYFDSCTVNFLQRAPRGLVVNLGCGLDTRFQRLDDGRIHLVDLDLPPVIAFKRNLLEESARYRFVPSSVLDLGWQEQLKRDRHAAPDGPVLFLAEGLLMYLPADAVRRLVLSLQANFPGCELVAEVFNRAWLQGWRGRLMRRRLQDRLGFGQEATFQSGLGHNREMEEWGPGIHFLGDWSTFDSDHPKMKSMAWLRRFSTIRNLQYAVRYQLDEPGQRAG